jgi:hypothetical protein
VKAQFFHTYVQIKCPFMHHHIQSPIQQTLVSIENIIRIGHMGVYVPKIQISLSQLHYKHEITNNTLSRLQKLD